MKTQVSQSYLWQPGRDSSFSQRSCSVSQPFLKGRKNSHVTSSWAWLHTVSQTQVLLIKTGSVQILISPHVHIWHPRTRRLAGVQPACFPNSSKQKFLLSLHSNDPNATLRQDDNSINS
ncbi:hypothetical protein AMECASPLE_016784 [Ameca splendens]|uniref:Uncharacterized protein n=1 Tax=Ameca splendens TaxID=208324 RepID=A0ABV0XR64_9TELE